MAPKYIYHIVLQVSRLPSQPPPDELLLDGAKRGVLRTHLQHANVRIRRQVKVLVTSPKKDKEKQLF